MQPFCDRSKVVMEPMLTDQWYVDAAKLAGPARDAVTDGRVKIMPESGEKVYFHWMNNIEPWCISRQLWWGHQIPVWYGHTNETLDNLPDNSGRLRSDSQDTKKFCYASKEEVMEAAQNYYGPNVTITIDAEDNHVLTHSSKKILGKVSVNLRQDPDVLDTWFSSGLWPIGTLGWPAETDELKRFFPTSTLITGQDILFFWVARMMMMQLEITGEVPFDTVYLHQLVRDEKGVKMSKTLGNVIDPLDMIDEYGADAVRFSMASMASIGGTLKLSMDRVEGYRNFTTKLWNAVSFAQYNQCIPDPEFDPAAATLPLNKWMIGEAAKAFETYDAALKAYRFNDAASAAYVFVRGTLCDRYLEFTKPVFFSDDAAAIAETRATMAWIIDQALILLHPVMPFITEELWGIIADRDTMLVHQDWPQYTTAELVDADANREMDWVISLVDSIRSARAGVNVPAGAKIPMLQQQLDDKGRRAWTNNEALIKRLARIETLEEVTDLPTGAVTIAVDGGVFALPLADIIEVAAEKARLEKTLGKLGKELGGLRGRLNNPKFVASAPEAVVAESRETLTLKEAEEAKLKAAFERLAEMG
jgi:valyl-tRNA synthetase